MPDGSSSWCRLVLWALLVPGCRPAAAPVIGGGWSYQGGGGGGAKELTVEAYFSKGSAGRLGVAEGAAAYVRGVMVEEGGWREVAPEGGTWGVAACRERGCRVRYRFALEEAATALDTMDLALRHGASFLTMPASWMLRPLQAGGEAPVEVRFSVPAGVRVVSGMSEAAPGVFLLNIEDTGQPPYVGFGAFVSDEVAVEGGKIEVAIAGSSVGDGFRGGVRSWVEKNAALVASVAGGASLPRVLVMVVPVPGDGVRGGVTLGNGGASVVMWVGSEVQLRYLEQDWVLLHELLHVAFPSLPAEQHWMEEGFSSYFEPLLRARDGRITEAEAWGALCTGLPAKRVEGPLNGAQDWERVYQGGALFYLQVEVEARSRGGSLGGLLRAVRGGGGNVARRWPVERLLVASDEGTGGALRRRYEAVGPAKGALDAAPVLASLGVRCETDRVVFDEQAPGAAVRRALTAR